MLIFQAALSHNQGCNQKYLNTAKGVGGLGDSQSQLNSKDNREEFDLEHDSPKNNSVPKHDVVL